MIYKLKLSRSTQILTTVDIPVDFNLKVGDILLVSDQHHEVKHIIRPTILISDIEDRKPPSIDQLNNAIPILIISDSFPLI